MAEQLAKHRNKGLEEERPQIATITRIADRTTDGSVTATLDRSSKTIWVETGGFVQDLAVSDKIWVIPLTGGGVSGQRAQWMMFGFRETSGGSHVPTVRPDALKVSELYASDADPQALDTDADGVMSALQNLKMDDGTGDSPSLQFVGGSNDDTVSVFLEDDASAGDSDLVIKLVDAAGDSKLLIRDSGDVDVVDIDSNGRITADSGLASGGTVTLDDGAGDSPAIQLVGGSNDDTVSLFLEDDAVAGDSDIVLKLADAGGDSKLLIRDSGDVDVATIDSDGNITGLLPDHKHLGVAGDGGVVDKVSEGGTPRVEVVSDNVIVQLGDNAGVAEFRIRDSDNSNQFLVDSDCNVFLEGPIRKSTSIDVRVVLSAAEAISDATEEAIPWDAETYDNVDDNWAIGNATRLTAQRDGNYLISFGGEWAEDTTGYRQMSIKLNGSAYLAVDQRDATNHYKFCISTQYELSSTDYVEAVVYQTSGGALNIINATYTYFAMTRLP
jgi:hypothetical protein